MLEWFSLLICENDYLSLFWSFARTRYAACCNTVLRYTAYCNAVCGGLRDVEGFYIEVVFFSKSVAKLLNQFPMICANASCGMLSLCPDAFLPSVFVPFHRFVLLSKRNKLCGWAVHILPYKLKCRVRVAEAV